MPLAYFITFHTYGTWLHGQDSGSVVDGQNRPGDPLIPTTPALESSSRELMPEPPYCLTTPTARDAVLDVLREVCAHRGWFIHAAHVRTTHVHLVVSGNAALEKVLTDIKAYATRRLKAIRDEPTRRHRWSHHGSTRYLWDEESVAGAIRCTLEEQGAPMAAYLAGSSEPGA